MTIKYECGEWWGWEREVGSRCWVGFRMTVSDGLSSTRERSAASRQESLSYLVAARMAPVSVTVCSLRVVFLYHNLIVRYKIDHSLRVLYIL